MINEIKIGYKPSYTAEINHSKNMKITVLKSVDNTKFYNDDLTDFNKGDENENKYNY